MQGGHAAKFRKVIRRLERDGATFRVVEPADVPKVIAELRDVSDEWLGVKAGAEKGFSLGHFDESYLCRLPVAVYRSVDGTHRHDERRLYRRRALSHRGQAPHRDGRDRRRRKAKS
jgi:hypothetical protein